ncbi:MAG: glycosyltransferase family 2 protein [Verrucomicrobiota bacterium]
MNTAAETEGKPGPENCNPQLSIIIISFNTREITAACLRSIQESALKLTYEILVVDNASSDGSPDMIERDFPAVKLIRNPENQMFAKANNQAIRVAKGNYILLLNSDTRIEPGNLEKLYDFIDKNRPRIGCVGPRVLNSDGTTQSEGETFDSVRNVLCNFFFLHKLPLPFSIKAKILPPGFPHGLNGRTRRVGWVTGCSMMFPTEIFTTVGELDESFVFYCEETEFCFRLMKHGFETWVVPDATLTHLGGASLLAAKSMEKAFRPEFPDYFERRFLFYQKTSGARHKIQLNRLRIFLYSGILPLLTLLRPGMADQLRDKIKYHTEENRQFAEQLAKHS